jgi:hypothetical protein
MRFLFLTIQSFECDFYARVGEELQGRGHDVSHLTYSRAAASRLRRRGAEAESLLDLLPAADAQHAQAAEVDRIERQYELHSIRDVYWFDPASEQRSEDWALRRTVAHFRAIEDVFERVQPDMLVPEVGKELPRTVAHRVALERGVTTLFLFYTIFPRPLRLYADTMHAPIVAPEDLRDLAPEERADVERFIAEFTSRAAPIREPRRIAPTAGRLARARSYVRDRLVDDRDNEYLQPARWALDHVAGWGRSVAARPLYDAPRPGRRFVYFPLHDAEDYKIKAVIPHCADQEAIIGQVADALPPGYDLVLKEHPMSIGRNPVSMLRRLRRRPNVRLVDPSTSSHELIQRSDGVVVISSTVGLEALLYGKPVLTLGRPFYAGYGVTVDLDSFAEIRAAVPALPHFRPNREQILRFLHAAMERCYAGAPVLVDRSEENARMLAATLDEAVTEPTRIRPGSLVRG